MSATLHIIGISDSGLQSLAPKPLELVQAAGFIAGGTRHLEFVAHLPAEKFALKANLDELAGVLKQRLEDGGAKPVVVLASGDPLFFGVARSLAQRLPGQAIRVLPAASAMQTAFARLALSWEDACLVSVHGRPMAKLLAAPPDCAKLAVFTDEKNHPAAVAQALMRMGWKAEDRAVVLEDLDNPGEKITDSTLGALAGLVFGKLNTLVALRERPLPAPLYAFGLPEPEFAQRKPQEGLITKSEVRAVSLSKMRLHPEAVVWDIGAGSGSVAIEAGRLARKGRVWAVEKNEEDCGNVRENIARFGALNVECIHGKAPEALAQIPDDPDAVFIGGSAGKLAEILERCAARLRPGGRLVLNTITLENTAEALEWFKAAGLEWDCLQMQVSRRKPILDLQRLEALNPIFIFWAAKP